MATAVQIGNAEVGEAQRLFAQQAETAAIELKESGQCPPYTVINFNPVEVGLQGELGRYKVWTADDQRLPKDVLRISIPWENKDRRGHVLTLRDPHKFGKMVGASGTGNPGEVIPQREPKLFTPQAVAFHFMEHFSPIFTAPKGVQLPSPPKDARKIFGLLVFEGDIHTLEKVMNEEDPAKRIIRVPIAIMTSVGKSSIRTYRAVEYNLDDYLRQMFAGQRRFADATVARAQQKWSETETIADISDSDRIWFRWLIELGYAARPKAGEKTWLNEYLVNPDQEVKDLTLRKCQACKAVEPEHDTPFCPKCAAPINTFTTFMAGFPVSESWLMALKGEERALAIEEMKARKQGFGDEPAATAVGESKPDRMAAARAAKAAKAAAIDPTEEIPDAATTALPGEE